MMSHSNFVCKQHYLVLPLYSYLIHISNVTLWNAFGVLGTLYNLINLQSVILRIDNFDIRLLENFD